MTPEQHNELICTYARAVVDGMDNDCLETFAYDQIVNNLREADLSDEQLIREVQNNAPDLLED